MPVQDILPIIGQLGASGIFAAALVAVWRNYEKHLTDEITYLRQRVECLETEVTKLRNLTINTPGN